jgi:hypothetical protein
MQQCYVNSRKANLIRFSLTLVRLKIRGLIEGQEILDAIDTCLKRYEENFHCPFNKRANLYNENIRSRILYLENEMQ